MDDASTIHSPSVYHTAMESGAAESPHPFRSPLTSNATSTSDADLTPRAPAPLSSFLSHAPAGNASPVMLRRFVDEHAHPESTIPVLTPGPVLTPTPVAFRLRRSPRLSTPRGSTPQLIPSTPAAPAPTQSLQSPLTRPQLSGVSMSDPTYPTALSIAVDQRVSALTALNCTREAQAFMALHAQSAKDHGSAELLDALLRGTAAERQLRDFARYADDVANMGERAGADGESVGKTRRTALVREEVGQEEEDEEEEKEEEEKKKQVLEAVVIMPAEQRVHDEGFLEADVEEEVGGVTETNAQEPEAASVKVAAAAPRSRKGTAKPAGNATAKHNKKRARKRHRASRTRPPKDAQHPAHKSQSDDPSQQQHDAGREAISYHDARAGAYVEASETHSLSRRARKRRSRMFQGAGGPVYSFDWCSVPAGRIMRLASISGRLPQALPER